MSNQSEQPKHAGETRILVKELLDTINVKHAKVDMYFMFPSGRRIHKIYALQSKEIFYTNLLTKKSARIKVNLNPEREIINVSHIFKSDATTCPF